MESFGKIAKLKQSGHVAKANPHLHSPAHLLADELSLKFNDKKHFALYLGMAIKYDHGFLRSLAGQVLESRDVKTPGKLFAFLVKKANLAQKESK